MRKVRDWSSVIDRLNNNPKGELKIKMGSPGSAQVTRCRLLAEWSLSLIHISEPTRPY